MSYMDMKMSHGSGIREIDFSSDIRELTMAEVDEVNGAFVQFVVVAALRCAASTACRVGALAVAGAAAAAVGYENNRV